MADKPSLQVYPVDNYLFEVADRPIREADKNIRVRLEVLEKDYALNGMATSIEIVMLMHSHGHPLLLVLQRDPDTFLLPSIVVARGQADEETVLKLMEDRFALGTDSWSLGDHLGTWWRPNFEIFTYPYCPAHCTRPKEQIRLYAVHIKDKRTAEKMASFYLFLSSDLFGSEMLEFDRRALHGDP